MTTLLETRLTGTVTAEDVARWKTSLDESLAAIPENGTFALLVDIRGYEPADLDAHKAFRVVIPMTLARHGFRPGFADLFNAEVEVTRTRGITCVAHANVHHDAAKMASYEEKLARENERFFTDADAARAWIRQFADPSILLSV